MLTAISPVAALRAKRMWREETNYNLHTFLENLRKNEKKRKAKIVSRVKETTLRK